MKYAKTITVLIAILLVFSVSSCSSPSTEKEDISILDGAALEKPLNLNAQSRFGANVITWNRVPNAQRYVICRTGDGHVQMRLGNLPASQNHYVDFSATGNVLKANEVYTYYVAATQDSSRAVDTQYILDGSEDLLDSDWAEISVTVKAENVPVAGTAITGPETVTYTTYTSPSVTDWNGMYIVVDVDADKVDGYAVTAESFATLTSVTEGITDGAFDGGLPAKIRIPAVNNKIELPFPGEWTISQQYCTASDLYRASDIKNSETKVASDMFVTAKYTQNLPVLTVTDRGSNSFSIQTTLGEQLTADNATAVVFRAVHNTNLNTYSDLTKLSIGESSGTTRKTYRYVDVGLGLDTAIKYVYIMTVYVDGKVASVDVKENSVAGVFANTLTTAWNNTSVAVVVTLDTTNLLGGGRLPITSIDGWKLSRSDSPYRTGTDVPLTLDNTTISTVNDTITIVDAGCTQTTNYYYTLTATSTDDVTWIYKGSYNP